MSPNPSGSIGAMPSAGTKLSPFDVGHAYAREVTWNTPGKKDQVHKQKHLLKTGSNDVTESQASSGDGAGGAEDGDADESDGNSDEVDEDSSNAEDPNVKAPSECAAGVSGHQTGSNSTDEGLHVTMKVLEDPNDNSDDEAYDDLDNISHAEKDGSEMDYLEERVIVDSEDDQPRRTDLATKKERSPAFEDPLGYDSDDFYGGLGLGHEHQGEPSDFDEKFSRTFFDGFDGDSSSALPSDFAVATNYRFPSPPLPSQRRVHFAEPPHSEIGGLGTNPIFREQAQEVPRSSSPNLEDLGGYETDYGETTDEDDVPGPATARPQALMRRLSTSTNKTSSSGAPPAGPKTVNPPEGPRMASWFVDPTKPVALVDSRTKQLLVFPALRPTKPDNVFSHLTGSGLSTANASPRTPSSQMAVVPHPSPVDHSDLSSPGILSPMLGPPNALENMFSRNSLATSESYAAQYAAASSAYYADMIFDGGIMGDDEDEDDNEDGVESFENGILMSELVNIDSDDEEEEEDSRFLFSASDFIELPDARQSPPSFLNHLDHGYVTAFRDNQHRVEEEQPEMLQPHSPLRKRKASPLLHEATRRRIAT